MILQTLVESVGVFLCFYHCFKVEILVTFIILPYIPSKRASVSIQVIHKKMSCDKKYNDTMSTNETMFSIDTMIWIILM